MEAVKNSFKNAKAYSNSAIVNLKIEIAENNLRVVEGDIAIGYEKLSDLGLQNRELSQRVNDLESRNQNLMKINL
ncbi:hypothetical protein [Coxiella endosymbiont of Ornithodoros maritimus]|uniref:hypothetical protein n=1 Tax=Coxiella endosymbiont of Ornithodoros maritimus TaxID=1656172 RepID=UPI00226455C1|nr:hypothetical protein [Coxiella endosymbiont of Ornithodoros maritimus]